ncbi:uncharacterized protein LOC114752895 isoform X2 [Neltuma alba]|uniref:uncharacterized protein LOC114752895 isoform X2 n=1 Tax=Neltuma alba TaxID=207710 RepID=UPI0010A382F5|nr:uncharacterized protein LOC114752895 isoform X2 [Prosopis alba]
MALLSSISSSPRSPSPFLFNHLLHSPPPPPPSCSFISRLCFTSFNLSTQFSSSPISAMPPSSPKIDTSLLTLDESFYDDELWAASSLRVRSFREFPPDTFGLQDLVKCLTEREFEALKERVSGTRAGLRRVSCINASLPESLVSRICSELCSACKVMGSDITRAYLSNVCVAKELQRNGLGYALLEKAKMVAYDWGITDLYVHVAVNNEPARKLYVKSGFVYESDEPAWQARFLDRPRRLLLWTGLSRA